MMKAIGNEFGYQKSCVKAKRCIGFGALFACLYIMNLGC